MASPSDAKLFRSDSLYARLKTDENRFQVYAWMAVDCIGPEETAKKIEQEFQVKTSAAAVCEMQKRCGLAWRIQRAAQLAVEEEKKLPANIDDLTRLRLQQQYRDTAFENLSRAEILAFQQYELSVKIHNDNLAKTKIELKQKDKALKQKDIALKQKDRSLQQSERRVKLLEANAEKAKKQLTDLAKGGKSKGLTEATLRKIEEAAKLL